MTPRVSPFVLYTSYFTWLILSVCFFPFRIEVLTCCSQCRLHTKKERLRKPLAEVETDEDSDFDNEDNRPEDVLEENFSDFESFSEHDTELEGGGDSGNGELNNSEWFTSEDGAQWRKRKFRQNIRTCCLNTVSRLPGTKEPAKDVTSSAKIWELFKNDNMIQLIVECTNIFIEKCATNFSRESDARKTDPLEI
ncbi:hypothetical protein AVEN_161810-1 [Araneus ventricosus]|uniref:PiggyBac transposable element-derived protein domain-containing protein n=1 Tax=Araneus ventricosus TaxID=182803 RepID=A0A4Y2EVH6_ARAVE|nr:hypothetical protein AVEN_161810-1 [Araneus ventricosus]